MDYKVAFNNWISNPLLTAEAYEELNAVKDNLEELEFRFSSELDFKNAIMQGLIGYGTNMFNAYTVKRATKGVAEYIKSLGIVEMERGVVICYDTRKNSQAFAKSCAGVLIRNGISVKIFKNASPTAMLSFAIKRFNSAMGIMITANNDLKEYGGFKVYGEDGALASIEVSKKIEFYINQVCDLFSIEETPVNQLKKQRYLYIIGKRFFKKYVKAVCKTSLSKKAVKKHGKKVKIVLTSVESAGQAPLTAVFKRLGINAVLDSSLQGEILQPSIENAIEQAKLQADKNLSSVILGVNVNAERLSVAVKDEDGNFINLTGNQTGILLTDYVLKRLAEEEKLNKNGVVVKSFVSSGMAKYICDSYGVLLEEVPVGFKHIAKKISEYQIDKSKPFIFAFDQNHAYLKGNHCLEKDAVVASMLFAEMVCYYEGLNKNVYSVLIELYEKYGYFIDKVDAITFAEKDATSKINAVIEKLRNSKIENIGGYNVLATRDYLLGERTQTSGEKTALDYSDVNCLYYELEIGGHIAIRKSAIEPKLKIHYSVTGKDFNLSNNSIEILQKEFSKLIK